MIIRTQNGVYTHSEWWQQVKVEGSKASLLNAQMPIGTLLLLNKRKEGMPKAVFDDLSTALEQSRKFFDVSTWCKEFEQSVQGTKKQATKEG